MATGITAPEGSELVTADYARTPERETVHAGERYMIRTCYDLIDGRWEAFVSMRAVRA